MMAHVNSSGTHIPLWMVSPDMSIGWGTSPAFPTREGTFFGQLMLTNAENNIDAYYCDGPGTDQNVVPGRLGANQGSVLYANAFPKSMGMDGLCDTAHSTGGCTTHMTNGVVDGDASCSLLGTTYKHPLTVWRGATYQAEAAQGGAWLANGTTPCLAGTSGCLWAPGGLGMRASNCTTPGTNGCMIIVDSNNGMGQRVGYIGAGKGVRFSNVTAPATSSNIIVYYTNGDAYSQTRYLSFVVNGGAPQVRAFGGLLDWSHPRGAAVTLSGFMLGSNNTITVTGDASGNST